MKSAIIALSLLVVGFFVGWYSSAPVHPVSDNDRVGPASFEVEEPNDTEFLQCRIKYVKTGTDTYEVMSSNKLNQRFTLISNETNTLQYRDGVFKLYLVDLKENVARISYIHDARHFGERGISSGVLSLPVKRSE